MAFAVDLDGAARVEHLSDVASAVSRDVPALDTSQLINLASNHSQQLAGELWNSGCEVAFLWSFSSTWTRFALRVLS